MYNFFKKKQNINNTKKIFNYYNLLLINKTKIKNSKIIKDADISFPVFFKGINNFTLSGLTVRKKKKINDINQTITIQSKLFKQLITLQVNTQCPLIKIR